MRNLEEKWITKSITDETIQWADESAAEAKRGGLTTSQIRRFFGEVKRIQLNYEKDDPSIPLLKAKLAYAAGRFKQVKPFYRAVSPAMDRITESEENFSRFASIMEAFIAYHKYHGGN